MELTQNHIRQGTPRLVYGTVVSQRSDKPEVLLGKIAQSLAFSRRFSGVVWDRAGKAMSVQQALVNAPANTADTELVAAVANRIIRVLSVVAIAGDTATELTFKSKLGVAASVAISPLLSNDVRGGEVLPHNDHGWFNTASGAALTVTTGAGSATGILINYVLVNGLYVETDDGMVLIGNDGEPVLLNA